MPTDETPSAAAMARREVLEWDGIEQAAGGSTRMPWEEQRERLIGRMAVALEAFAREREAAVVREAHPYLRHQDTCGYWSNPNAMSDYKCTCGLVQFRARAAEARRNG